MPQPITYPDETAEQTGLTIQEFMDLPEEPGYTLELVRGQVVREPGPRPLHGRVDAILTSYLNQFATEHDLGPVLSNTGFALSTEPATVRLPDIAFVSHDRTPPQGYSDELWYFAPDLAVEIISPSNTSTEIQEKVVDYLDAGARLVWVVDPRPRTVAVYRPEGEMRLLRDGDVLDGGAVLPDFRLPLPELFAL